MQKVAAILQQCTVKQWLFLPGNNDLIDEDPGTLEHYTNFIAGLHGWLHDAGVEVIDLTPRPEDENSGVHREGDYSFIGFNNASFKSNNTANNLEDNRWIAATSEAVEAVQKRVEKAKNAYIFYHIPEVDDPYYALNAGPEETENWFAARKVGQSPYKYSAWTVRDDVRASWDRIAALSNVRGLYAGHFHDHHRETYLNFRWLTTTGYSAAALVKLHICPPLAEKRQEKAAQQARGFQVVKLADDGTPTQEIVWYQSASFSTEGVDQTGGPLLNNNVLLAVDPSTNTASAVLHLFNNESKPLKLLLTATDFVSTSTRRALGATVNFAADGQTGGKQLCETVLEPGAAIAVRVEATKVWEAGESLAHLLDHGAPVGTLRAIKSRPPFTVKLAGDKTEIDFVDGEAQRIALHNDDAMTYIGSARVAFGNRVSDPLNIQLAPGSDGSFEITLPPNWFPASSVLKRRVIDGEISLAFDPPGETSAPDLPRRRIPFKGSLNICGPTTQGVFSYAFILFFLVAGGVLSLVMSNYFPNQSRQRALVDAIDSLAQDIDALPAGIESELRVLLRVECHRFRTLLMNLNMFSAEAPSVLDSIADKTKLLRRKTELVATLHDLEQKLASFIPPSDKVKPIVDTATKTREALRATTCSDAALDAWAKAIAKALDDLAMESPPTGTTADKPPAKDFDQIADELKKRNPTIVMHPPIAQAYQVVTLAVIFADNQPPPDGVLCHWDCGDGFQESNWKISHYYSDRKANYDVNATFWLPGNPKKLGDTKTTLAIRAAQSESGMGARNKAEAARLGFALGIALLGVLAAAQDQLAKLDFFAAASAVFLLGFTANAAKDIVAPKQAKG